MPATSPRTGVASLSITSLSDARPCPRCGDSRRPVPAPIVLGHPVTNPETIATAIRIGNPASWVPALDVNSRITRRHPRRDRMTKSSTPTATSRVTSRSSVSRPRRRRSPASSSTACRRTRRSSVSLTGNGLKDPDTAVETSVTPDIVDATLKALLAKLS